MAARRDNLSRYRQMRDFSKTPEPEGVTGKGEGFRYLIQKHAATRLHYDFRLELDGTLKSWAVTRGPSLDPHDKRLAVEVEDHPVAYGSFEGIIPKGQYGGGTVMLWDEGTWEPIGDPRKGLEKGKLEFKLHGKRLTGEWTLVRMKGRAEDRGRNNWLLIKHRDEVAREGDKDRLLTGNITSIVSGRTMEKIAAAKDKVWRGKAEAKEAPKKADPKAKAAPKKAAPKRAARLKLPAFIPPQLATLADETPPGREWVHEIKFDGYRALAYLQNGEVTMYTRNGLDWTKKFASVARALAALDVENAIFDGEIVAPDEKGSASFKSLQASLKAGQDATLQYYVFDLLHVNGKDMRPLTLLERKQALEKLLAAPALHNRVIYSEHVETDGAKMLKRMCGLELEGVISKRADAPYRSGRGAAWLKTKCHKSQEFVIGGFTLPTHATRGVGALLLGYYEDEELRYAGKVGTGFDNATSLALRKKLDKLAADSYPFVSVTAEGRRGAHWVEPELVCEVEFTEWTPDGHLRHPSFQGLREDKPAPKIHRDRAAKTKELVKAAPAAAGRHGKAEVGGIAISHPDRLLFSGTSITKERLAEYYLAVAEHILPHVAERPLSMLRCPEGADKECFFQRHIARGQSRHIHSTGIEVKGRDEAYLMIRDVEGLVSLVQWGVIELHPWGCLASAPDKPDRMIFDLDPDPEVPFAQVMEGAKEVRGRMKELGLTSFVKTTGGKGLHVVIPMTRHYGWDTIKAFSRAVAESMQHDRPERYIAKASKAARKGKIFVDYLRNDHTATGVAAFSVRAREGAPVAMPVAWEKLTPGFSPKQFTLETVPQLLAKTRSDPWKDFFRLKQKIAAAHLKALGIEPG